MPDNPVHLANSIRAYLAAIRKITQANLALYQATAEAQAAWEGIPAAQRASLKPPTG